MKKNRISCTRSGFAVRVIGVLDLHRSNWP